MVAAFADKGWQIFAPEPATVGWAERARARALRALDDPAMAHWYQCGGTWFVGLDALDNDEQGRIGGSGPLTGAAVDFIDTHLGGWPALHRGQLSAVFQGYPKPRAGENDAAFRYRMNRDAAHVDGLIGEGRPKRRFLREPHQFILGIPLTRAEAAAAPLVVWEGSHHIIQAAFEDAFAGRRAEEVTNLDVTEIYKAARSAVFDNCVRVPLPAPPGSAILLHRLALHGVAPWQDGAKAEKPGRLIAYFRPPMPGGSLAWATEP